MAVTAAVAGCDARPDTPPTNSPTTAEKSGAGPVNPLYIVRARAALPPGYETATISGAAPATFWGFGTAWTADPDHCAGLAAPAVDVGQAHGWSGSGPGGIVYAVVAPTGAGLDPAVVDECREWTLTAGRTSGTVTLVDAPEIEDAATVGMTETAVTVVEGGSETHMRAETFTAYLGGQAGDYTVSSTVVTDPGAPGPPLEPGFGAALLVKIVSALRG